MMQTLRKNAKFFLWIVLLAFVLTIFALWGMQGAVGSGQNPEVIAKIGDDEITYSMLSSAWNNRREELYSEGRQVTEELEKKEKKEILDMIITHKLRLKYADSLGITASDEEVGRQIKSYPAFSTKEGGFDKNIYIGFLNNNRIRPEEFENEQREQIISYKLRNQLITAIKASSDELKELYLKLSRSIKGDYVSFGYKDFLTSVKIEEEKMKDYYAINKQKYEKPERVKASHILIMADASPSSPTGLTDEAAKKLAEKLVSELNAGASFSSLAKKHSSDPGSKEKGGDLGWFERGMMVKEFEDAAFSLKKGALSGAVKTQFGYHIIKCEDKDSGFEPTYDKVKKEILSEMQKAEAMSVASKKASEFSELLKEGKNMADAAATLKTPLKKTPYFMEDGLKEIESDSFAATALNLNNGETSGVISGQEAYFIFILTDEKPAQYDRNKFELRKDKLSEMLTSIKYNAYMETLTAELKNKYKLEVFEENLLN